MKLFITSLIVLAIIVILCTVGTAYGTKAIDNMISTLEKVIGSNEIPRNATEIYTSLSNGWEKRSFILSMLLPHHHLDKVKEKLIHLGAYAETNEFAEWYDAVLALKEELQHIRGLVGISFDNIL